MHPHGTEAIIPPYPGASQGLKDKVAERGQGH